MRRGYDGYKGAFEALTKEIAMVRDERDALRASADRRLRAKTSLPPVLQSRQLCFLHIGKTAGTSVQHLLFEALPDAEVFHAALLEFDQATERDIAGCDLVVGHFTYQHTSKLRSRRFLFTFLRDPIEQVISNYYFLRGQTRSGDSISEPAWQAAHEYSLKEFLLCDDVNVRMYTSNHQSKVIAFDHRPEFLGKIDILGAAQLHLQEFDFVGISEHFDMSIQLLSQKLRLNTVLAPTRLNVGEERRLVRNPTIDVIEIIRQLNDTDLEFYGSALEKFKQL